MLRELSEGSVGFGIDDVRSESGGHTEDALIAVTASHMADVLVTQDKRLAKQILALGGSCDVWGFDKFNEWVEERSKKLG